MKQQFKSVRDIIDDYEWFVLPIIKRELAQCKDEEKCVYGISTHFQDKLISCNGIADTITEVNDDEYEQLLEECFDISANDLLKLYKNLHGNVSYTMPNSHQKRWYNRLGDIVKALQELKIQDYRFSDFEHLYDVVRTIFVLNGHPSAFLTIYDTALRIGYNHAEPLYPSKFVYLYGGIGKRGKPIGPLGGAIKLYGSKWVKDHLDKDYPHRIETRWFDKFQNLPSWEIESILCIYADSFVYDMPY